ncbi:MAG: DNA polymerase III subunit epsilon [Zoogloeaceae bacterium]|jgi:DNA polymerase-3 subunit epsilon|nr:DNA polymerase III subunit epsilon [Zoogloeaceae bacterium]
MRQIFLDTETTGLEPKHGHRIIEIACVEMQNRRLTGRRLHFYLNPEREIEAGAMAVHGINNEFLEDKPRFAQIAKELCAFIHGAELVIHNAPFDIGFLDAEFARLDLPDTKTVCADVLDTLTMARDLHPGKKNNLDALCERYQVNNAHRNLHGALLDAELLAEVYIAMTRGQESLLAEEAPAAKRQNSRIETRHRPARDARASLPVLCATPEEEAEHQKILTGILKESKGRCLWAKS